MLPVHVWQDEPQALHEGRDGSRRHRLNLVCWYSRAVQTSCKPQRAITERGDSATNRTGVRVYERWGTRGAHQGAAAGSLQSVRPHSQTAARR